MRLSGGSKITRTILSATLLLAVLLMFSGCVNLKPVEDSTRSFVLTPVAIKSAPELIRPVSVGIGRVEIPEYLQSKRIAVRKGTSEVTFSESLQWAERLDRGVQRVIGANLESLLGATSTVMSTWRRSEVQAEVYVSVQRFESDEQGQAVLEVRWRITSPGGEATLRSGQSTLTTKGPSFAAQPADAVATLDQLLAGLSRDLSAAVRESLAPQSK